MSPLPLPYASPKAGFLARSAAESPSAGEHLVDRAVARAKQGDRQALEFLYVRYADHIYGYVRSILHDAHDAEDVTQQVFAKLMTVLERYDRRRVPFFAWLLRLAHNAAIDQLRSRRAIPAPEIFGSDDRSDETGLESGQLPARCTGDASRGSAHASSSSGTSSGSRPRESPGGCSAAKAPSTACTTAGRRALQAELLRHQAGPCTANVRGRHIAA